jgi:ABC-type transport system involved in multi-copper enzyme maturation permease subunit
MSAPAPAPAPASVTVRTPRRRLDVFETVWQVAQVTFRRALRGRRLLGAAAVVLLPAAIALLVRWGGADTKEQERFFFQALSKFHFGIAVPVVAMLFATAFPWPEAEEGTLTYWFTSPVRRSGVLLGRYVASLALGWLLLPLCVLAISLPLSTGEDAGVGRVTEVALTSTLLAYPAYLALFQLVATVFRRGLALGVVYAFVEFFVSLLTGTIVKLTLVHYVRSQLRPAMPKLDRIRVDDVLGANEPAANATCVAVFVGVALTALVLSLVLVERIEYRGRTSQPG